MSTQNTALNPNTTTILFFPEETNRFNKTVKVLNKQKPQLISNASPLQCSIYKNMKIKPEEENSDSEDDKITEEERMNAYYGNYPKIYGYYPYFYGMKQHEESFKNNNTYGNHKQIEHKQTYGKYYKNKYGNKHTKIKISDINSQIDKKINNQYWRGKEENEDSKICKKMIEEAKNNKAEGKYDNMDIDDGQTLIVSNLISKVIKCKENEEDNDSIPDVSSDTQKKLVITSLCYPKKDNKLDDLQELLLESKKYAEAKNEVTNGKYTDSDFLPAPESILGFGERKDYTYEELLNYPWLRPEEFFKGNDIAIFHEIHSNDILQGSLGDCYFLAAISAIAEHSKRLERLFLTNKYNPEGIYVLALCIDGTWIDVVLDDTFPCQKYSKNPIFNTSISGELWVMLLEKAWAKVHGGYLNIVAGLTREALGDLTGAPAKTYFTNRKRDELWKILMDAERKHYIMCAGSDCLSNGSDALIEKIGIAGSHAYSLLAVYEFENINGYYRLLNHEEEREGKKIERIVKLRNPWGNGEWTGDWSDNSPLWNPELKEALEFVNADDGIFHMNYNDFCRYFSDCQICYYHDDYKYSAKTFESEPNESLYLQFEVEVEGTYYISVHQKSKRLFPKSERYKYSEIMFFMGRFEDSKLNYLGGDMGADKAIWIEVDIKPGKHIAIVKTLWSSFIKEFTFSIYGPDKTDIDMISHDLLPKNFIQQMMTDHAKLDTEQQYNDLSSQGYPQIKYKTFDNKGGFGYIYFENSTPDSDLEATVDFAGSTNIKLCYPYSGYKPSISVPANSSNICVYESKGLPYSTQLRILSSVKNVEGSQSLKEKVRASNTILSKSHYGEPVDINVYVLYHSNGLAMLYVNKTNDLTIDEEIEFDLNGCHIDGVYGSYIEIVCGPNSEKLLKIVKDEESEDFSANIAKMYYTCK